jgi:hypothetical protein
VKSLKAGGSTVAPGQEVKLHPGEQLELGDVVLTLVDQRRFVERVAAEAAKLRSA